MVVSFVVAMTGLTRKRALVPVKSNCFGSSLEVQRGTSPPGCELVWFEHKSTIIVREVRFEPFGKCPVAVPNWSSTSSSIIGYFSRVSV